jgi:F-type H+-transporting ATPase subunit gamma
MPSLKDLKNRITSVTSTRKITSAMKMVAASKLRRSQEQALAARPYASRMSKMLESLASGIASTEGLPRLLAGTGKEDTVLLLVVTSDRGLCGGFNSNVVREARRQIRELESAGKKVKLYCVGRKGRDLLRRDQASKILGMTLVAAKKYIDFSIADDLTRDLLERFEAGEFDVMRVVYNRFKSVISQETTVAQLVPVQIKKANDNKPSSSYEFEPEEEEILAKLLPRNLSTQIFSTILESAAGEWGARMAAMDSATRNAGDMINKLTLNYNRSRQAFITKELIEIISGAEAL